ncbi:cystathionine beta-lyase [Nocardioides daedukensis]|uniref:cysteine-S-conjugate beta-lyase n=1 Tax=Nocardioides daedukensis TaxID=634462 RepID=A0A7Y9UQY9_9ACTN|nr:aminotransferase class I/II-fold pyridoxal phosphate-dependent enzyme [Nocardioides daedukensis]NYG59081.1 cystathionine beta-lyase [Nocardioides daedukensis]
MRILGESLEELRATRTSVKWRGYDPDVVPVWVAEMDARPCAPVVDAVTAALGAGDTGYAFAAPFAEAFAGFAQRRWSWTVDADSTLIVPDVMIGVEEIIRVISGDAVVVSTPCYDSFHGFVEAARKRPVLAPLDSNHRLDPAALARAFEDAGRGSAYLLCNPQNPTGTVHTAEELGTLAALANEYGILVISDEIHAPLVAPGVRFTPYLEVPGAQSGVAIVSASKAFNLAGLKVALAVPGADCVIVKELHEVITHGANHLSVLAQTAAYNEGNAWLDQLNVEIVENRELLTDLLARDLPELRMTPAEATYLGWLDCRALGHDDPAAVFLERGRVALASGSRYDPQHGAGWARFNLGTSPAVIEEAVRRMVTAVR